MASSISFWQVLISVHSPFWRVLEKNGFPHCNGTTIIHSCAHTHLQPSNLNLLIWIKSLNLFLYWSLQKKEEKFTVLGPEDRCSSRGLHLWRTSLFGYFWNSEFKSSYTHSIVDRGNQCTSRKTITFSKVGNTPNRTQNLSGHRH